ncbi:hypothetical protein BOTBODRAFT_26699 [Botryobasidium botryosum FD-172 SS1]|uniref:Rhomboid-type serine protease n=1 Tax=Botryobasidium botryosum (strain FD-172 SS1) TaxID=930990 RepID=A0A067MYJ4_BOTB1|nr:hypothetical protein BOTBODRAFT_26699 [Botryobasidium botryosum FD-172 SS1]
MPYSTPYLDHPENTHDAIQRPPFDPHSPIEDDGFGRVYAAALLRPLDHTEFPQPSSSLLHSEEAGTDYVDCQKGISESGISDAFADHFAYYSRQQTQQGDHDPLVEHAAVAGQGYCQDLETPQTPQVAAKAGFFSNFLSQSARDPIEQRIEKKRRGIGRQKYPIAVWAIAVVILAVLMYELAVNGKQQGTPFSFTPFVNPMLGPSQPALIYLGARFPPCMKLVEGVPLTQQFGCMSNTENPPRKRCSLEQICGFGGFKGKKPNQWFRFITPIFLHAGLIHALLNLLGLLTVSAQVEREMGSGAFLVVYAAAGIFGNVFGGNFSLVGTPSTGASGAIFGTVAVQWVDLLSHWQFEEHPARKLITLIIELIIGVALGYIPGIDNFAHLGGFLMGILTATTFYPVISRTELHKRVMWGFRVLAILLVFILFVILIQNFYANNPYAACGWCRYLSCIPTAQNNHCKG